MGELNTILHLHSNPPLVIHQWGQAHFIFHCESGQTHYVNQSCADVLALITEGPIGTDQIYQRLLVRHSIDDDPELQDAIRDVVALLEQLGVVSSQS